MQLTQYTEYGSVCLQFSLILVGYKNINITFDCGLKAILLKHKNVTIPKVYVPVSQKSPN